MKKMKRFAAGDMIEGDASVSEQMEQMPAKAAPTPPKNRVVTKEELAASGLSLRDFLNKERGLTRRGEAAPAKSAAPEKTAAAPESKSMMDKKLMSGLTPREIIATPSAKNVGGDAAKAAQERRDAAQKSLSRNTIFEGEFGAKNVGGDAARAAQERRDAAQKRFSRSGEMKHGGSVKKMASGGSASKRADGIAQKGKTRGKMC